MQRTPSMNWGRETSPRPCTPRNERNLPKIRSLLHMAPMSQNDQPQRIERKLLAQTVPTDGQSPLNRPDFKLLPPLISPMLRDGLAPGYDGAWLTEGRWKKVRPW